MNENERQMLLTLLARCSDLAGELRAGGIETLRWDLKKIRVLEDALEAVLIYDDMLSDPLRAGIRKTNDE